MNTKVIFSKGLVLLISMVLLVSAFGIEPVGEIATNNTDSENEVNIPQQTGTRAMNDRTVLIELFTNIGCPPCANANPPLNELMDVFTPEKMVMIGYHGNFPYPNDPFYMDNPDEEDAREAYYVGDEILMGYPDMYWDGVINQPGAGADRTANYNLYKTNTNTRLGITTPVTISLDGTINSTDGTLDYTIDVTDSLPMGTLQIRFAVVEDNIYFNDEINGNGEVRHRNVFRDMLAEDTLPPMPPGQHTGSRSFTVQPWWNINNVGVIVFIQNDDDREVLQAAQLDYIPQKILVVDDDASTHPDGMEDAYQEIMCMGSISFDSWVLNEQGNPTSDDLSNYEVVIWITGSTSSNTLQAADRTAIQTYLDTTTGSLFVCGENIGLDLNSTATSFYNNYLYSTLILDDNNERFVTGISGDPISDLFFGMDLSISDASPSEIGPIGAGSAAFIYPGWLTCASVKAEHDIDSKVVYFAFNYFGSGDSVTNELNVMNKVLAWLQIEPLSVKLYEGYNLISIPNNHMDYSLDSVFDKIKGDYDAVQRYDATDTNDPWKHWMDSKPSEMNDLTMIDNIHGFWIRVTNPGETTFIFNGTELSSSSFLPLYTGWNMVGYPSATDRLRDAALNNVNFGSDVDAIWTYDAQLGQWKSLGSSDSFEVGCGYLIHSLTDITWDVPL